MELGEDSFDIGDEGEAHGYGPLDWRPDDDSTVYREAEARIKAGEGRNQVLHYMRLDSKELRRFGVQFIFFFVRCCTRYFCCSAVTYRAAVELGLQPFPGRTGRPKKCALFTNGEMEAMRAELGRLDCKLKSKTHDKFVVCIRDKLKERARTAGTNPFCITMPDDRSLVALRKELLPDEVEAIFEGAGLPPRNPVKKLQVDSPINRSRAMIFLPQRLRLQRAYREETKVLEKVQLAKVKEAEKLRKAAARTAAASAAKKAKNTPAFEKAKDAAKKTEVTEGWPGKDAEENTQC